MNLSTGSRELKQVEGVLVLRGVGLRPRSFVVGAIIMTVQLPPRIADGTRYIIEGEPAENGGVRVTRRYLVLPGGERLDLMPSAVAPARLNKPVKMSRRRVLPKKRVA